MLYQLMNKDKVVATYEEEKRLDDYRYTEIERLDGYVPYGFVDINDWIDGRQIAKHRTSIERLMRELGLTTRHDFISMARCLALTDTFWMKRADEGYLLERRVAVPQSFRRRYRSHCLDGTACTAGRILPRLLSSLPRAPSPSAGCARATRYRCSSVVPRLRQRGIRALFGSAGRRSVAGSVYRPCALYHREFSRQTCEQVPAVTSERWDLCRPIGSLTVLLMRKTRLPSATRTAATNRSVK